MIDSCIVIQSRSLLEMSWILRFYKSILLQRDPRMLKSVSHLLFASNDLFYTSLGTDLSHLTGHGPVQAVNST
jgi:hypothetical protein